MASTRIPVLTIGHSNHVPEAFLALLKRHGVDVVVDVRSAPYSRYLPHFNKEVLDETLRQAGIHYAFHGQELGGQPADRACYDADGRVAYDKLAATTAFMSGIKCILETVSVHPSTGSGRTDTSPERRLALMCSEKEPLDCHRTLLISQTLAKRGVAVAHIHADGSVESHEEAIDRLLHQLNLPPNGDLFRSREEVIEDAISRQAQKVGARWADPAMGGVRWERAL